MTAHVRDSYEKRTALGPREIPSNACKRKRSWVHNQLQ